MLGAAFYFTCLFLFNPQEDFMKLVFYSHLKDQGPDAARKRLSGKPVHPVSLDSTALLCGFPGLHHFFEIDHQATMYNLHS